MAEFDELLITTGVDALVRLVKEKGRIEVELAATLLNIPQATLEDWVHILEEEGILSLEYKLTKKYLVWVTPTAEQVQEKKTEIYGEKAGIEKEISAMRTRVSPALESFDDLKSSFSQFYQKTYPRLDQLEKSLSGLGRPGGAPSQLKEEMKKIHEKISSIEDATGGIKDDLDELKKQLATPPKQVKVSDASQIQEDVRSLSERLMELESSVAKLSKALPEDMPRGADAKKIFEILKKDFGEIRKACAIVRDDVINLKEASELLKGMGTEIKSYEQNISSLKGELETLMEKAEQVNSRSSDLLRKMKGQTDVLSHFADSVDIAKGVLSRFPTQEKLMDQLEEIDKKEKKIQEKMELLEKISLVPKGVMQEFEDLKKKIDQEKRFLEGESGSLIKSIADQSSVYNTFQKIRERSLVSLQAYFTQLKEIGEEIEKLKVQTAKTTEAIESGTQAYKGKLKEKEYTELLKAADEITKKKQVLDKISSTFESMTETADNLNRDIDILSKKIKLLDISASGVGAKAAEKERGEIVNQANLTREEEQDFRRKREELRELIRKLWEEQS
jgi:chromosome segregation ATPase